MSTTPEQTQIQSPVNEEEIKNKIKQKVLEYIKQNKILLMLKRATNDVLEHTYIDRDEIVEKIATFLLVIDNDKELVKNIKVDLYSRTLENNLYNYSPEEAEVSNIEIDNDRITAKLYLPNRWLLAETQILYNTNRIDYKEYYNKLQDTKLLINRIIDMLMDVRKENQELKQKLEECQKKNKETEEESEEESEEE
jgi:hypothetical protein